MKKPTYPFAAIVGQADMKLALIITAIAPTAGGVLIRGEKGTAKSTAARGLAELLPARVGYDTGGFHLQADEYDEYAQQLQLAEQAQLQLTTSRVPVVELPVGATEDRVVGTLDIEAALAKGKRRFEPGLLAAAHRGILYVDEVNLLEDHIVDLLLDSAAMGVNTVEREGISISHPARFALLGTMNPEEGDLRPQLLDRFGMTVAVTGEQDADLRIEVIERQLTYEADPVGFVEAWRGASEQLATQITAAMNALPSVRVGRPILAKVAQTCLDAGVDGHRADIMMVRVSRALAAWHGRRDVIEEDLVQAARFVLPHRMRRTPLETY